MVRSRLLALALVAALAVPMVDAAAQPSLKLETTTDFSRPPAGTTVTYTIRFDAIAADGQSSMDLELRYKDQAANAVAWNASLRLQRIGASGFATLPTLSGFDQPVIHRGMFEGKHELTVTVVTDHVIADFASFIELAVTRPDGSGRTTAGPFRYDFQLQRAPDRDNDGLSDALEAELGTDPDHPDTDRDGLTDCQEVKHTSREQCELVSFNGPYDGGYGTDPKKADTDGDGLRDDVEARSVTDPLKADTDGDGLNDCQETRHTVASECGSIASTLADGGYKSDPLVADQDGDGLMEGDEVRLGSDIFNPDTDGDGLTDGEEAHGTRNGAYGNASTDPTKKDTDGDGLSDFDEIVKYGTDPNNVDTDGDGLRDADEVQGPNSPLLADTDGDGLNDFDERNVHKTNPVVVDTDGDGLSDGDEVLIWKTRPLDPDTDQDGLNDGDEVAYGTDPHNHDSDADGLNDGPEVHQYGTDPANYDTDADGLSDGEEVSRSRTDPLDPDTDADQLLDGLELVVGTDPLKPDTDGDGWLDGVEVRTGSDPLDATSRPSDIDGDMVADVEDDDADGDGRPDDEVAEALTQAIVARIGNDIERQDVTDQGTVPVRLQWTAPQEVEEVQIWRGTPWQAVARMPASEGEFTDAARDGDLYRITAVFSIGAKTVGGDANATWFSQLDPVEVFVTGVKRLDEQSVAVRNGGSEPRSFRIEVDNGKTRSQDVVVAPQSQQVAALDLSGLRGAYTVYWNDDGERVQVMQGSLPGSDKEGDAAGMLLAASALLGSLAIVRRRK